MRVHSLRMNGRKGKETILNEELRLGKLEHGPPLTTTDVSVLSRPSAQLPNRSNSRRIYFSSIQTRKAWSASWQWEYVSGASPISKDQGKDRGWAVTLKSHPACLRPTSSKWAPIHKLNTALLAGNKGSLGCISLKSWQVSWPPAFCPF